MSARFTGFIAAAKMVWHGDLTSVLPRAILRLVVTAVVSPLQGGDATTRFSGVLPFLRNALAVWPETSPGASSLTRLLAPGFLFAQDIDTTAPLYLHN